METRREHANGADWVVKSASSAEEAGRLRHEAAQLRRAAHPGVVEVGWFTGSGAVELGTRLAGRSLRDTGPLPAAELCGLGAAVATVLADLHDIGIAHGAVGADHILVGADGRPVLCGFGWSGSTATHDRDVDVRDLAATLSARLGPDAPGRLVRELQKPGSGRRAPSARAFARSLRDIMISRRWPSPTPRRLEAAAADEIPVEGEPVASVDDVGATGTAAPGRTAATGAARQNPSPCEAAVATGRLGETSYGAEADEPAVDGPPDDTSVGSQPVDPQPVDPQPVYPIPLDRPAGSRPRATARTGRFLLAGRMSRRRIPTVALVAAIILLVAVLTWHRPQPAAFASCPTTDRGCGPVPVRAGSFAASSGTYRIALSHPVVVLGRWRCGPDSLPAALDPRTGQVWAWLAWAGPTDTTTARAVTTTSGARSLRVLPEPSGCDRLQVVQADGHVTVFSPGETRHA